MQVVTKFVKVQLHCLAHEEHNPDAPVMHGDATVRGADNDEQQCPGSDPLCGTNDDYGNEPRDEEPGYKT